MNQISLLRLTGPLMLALALVAFAWPSTQACATKAAVEKRADVIAIDAMAADGNLELPAVTFLHEQHTRALATAGKDCSSCHIPLGEGESAYSFSFMGSDKLRGEALKDLYHNNCIGCHADMRGSAVKTGPQKAECRSCHVNIPQVVSDRQNVGLDKVQHYKHISSPYIKYNDEEKNCGACHSEFDPDKKQNVWVKGKEDSWRASYLSAEERARALRFNPEALDLKGRPLAGQPTLDQYSHQTCINCHIKIAAIPSEQAGPINCAGCHSPEAQALFAEASAKIASTIPRLERGQEDSVLMLPPLEKDREINGMMAPVSFNHKFHESVSMDCRSCHHKRIDTCSSCHSLEGKQEGDFVNFSQAMHSTAARQSCVSCHNTEKRQPSCAGCHSTPPAHLPSSSCAACHTAPMGISMADAENGSLLSLSKEERKTLAERTVSQRDYKKAQIFPVGDIPETVTMGTLSKDYEPSKMPHRKIVETLLAKQKDNRMAAVFHNDPGTLCQGCHHNSPISKTPPKCVSCHGVDMKPAAGSLLSLKAAYHQQCITCHERMYQKPLATECADCHKPRGN